MKKSKTFSVLEIRYADDIKFAFVYKFANIYTNLICTKEPSRIISIVPIKVIFGFIFFSEFVRNNFVILNSEL